MNDVIARVPLVCGRGFAFTAAFFQNRAESFRQLESVDFSVLDCSTSVRPGDCIGRPFFDIFMRLDSAAPEKGAPGKPGLE